MNRSLQVALLLAAPALLAACHKEAAESSSGSGSTTAAPTTAPRPRATATAAPTGTAPAAGGACVFTGTWTGTYPPGPYPFSGTPLELTFNADGSGTSHSQRADSKVAWKVEGGKFSFHGTEPGKGGRFSCKVDEVGRYGFTFTPDCGGVTLKLDVDPCKGRAKTTDGMSLKRK